MNETEVVQRKDDVIEAFANRFRKINDVCDVIRIGRRCKDSSRSDTAFAKNRQPVRGKRVEANKQTAAW
tara:strand:- start:450289 stop:450495 length:207 start_codon:yes stop_codon:yes gene_type:complete